MPRTLLRRTLLAFSLALLLAAPWAAAVPGEDFARTGRIAAATAGDLLARLRGFLTSLWGEEGCRIDPHGACTPVTAEEPVAPDQQDAGCGIDPHGACTPRQ